MKLKMPKHFDLIYKVAKKYKLSYPKGRAIYTINRGQNAGWTNISLYEDRYYENNFKPTSREILKFLKTIRESTAIRWFNHWNNGGSVRSLGKKRKIK